VGVNAPKRMRYAGVITGVGNEPSQEFVYGIEHALALASLLINDLFV
jgi:hypothetical protein